MERHYDQILGDVVGLFPDEMVPGHHTFFVWRDAAHLAQWIASEDDDAVLIKRARTEFTIHLFPYQQLCRNTDCMASLAFDTLESHYEVKYTRAFAVPYENQ